MNILNIYGFIFEYFEYFNDFYLNYLQMRMRQLL